MPSTAMIAATITSGQPVPVPNTPKEHGAERGSALD
jgi:hypothetical protein